MISSVNDKNRVIKLCFQCTQKYPMLAIEISLLLSLDVKNGFGFSYCLE